MQLMSALSRLAGSSVAVSSSGCDPEIFVVDAEKKLIPAFKFLPDRESAKPHPAFLKPSWSDAGLEFKDNCGLTYWDGFQAEFTTKPQSCHGYLMDTVRAGLQATWNSARTVDPRAKLTLQSFFEISDEERMASEPRHVALGCMPSENAYATEAFCSDNPYAFPYRMAGGHLHYALNRAVDREGLTRIAQMLDLFLALPAVAIFGGLDNPLRRKFYGRAGEFRIPSYGIEYRTLSNAWLGHPGISHLVFDLGRRAVAAGADALTLLDLDMGPDNLREIIDNSDVAAARKFVKDNLHFWESLMGWTKFEPTKMTAFVNLLESGVEKVVPTYHDIGNNWKLDGSWFAHTNAMQGSWGSLAVRCV